MLSRRRLIAGSEDGTKDELVSDNEPEPFQEMCSIFRIVALYEMMMHAQWTYTFRFLRNQKTELVVGMYIGAAFELIRLLCVLIIAILLVLMRVSAISPFVTPRIIGNISWISSMNLLAIWTAALLCFLVSLQFAVYQGKSRESIVISTAINFCFSIILIFTVVHLAIWQTHQEVFLKEGLVKELMVAPHTMRNLYLYENRMKCCGIDGPSDYENENIVQYTNPLTNVKESLPLIRDFSFDGTHFYSLPRTCCRPGFRIKKMPSHSNELFKEHELLDDGVSLLQGEDPLDVEAEYSVEAGQDGVADVNGGGRVNDHTIQYDFSASQIANVASLVGKKEGGNGGKSELFTMLADFGISTPAELLAHFQKEERVEENAAREALFQSRQEVATAALKIEMLTEQLRASKAQLKKVEDQINSNRLSRADHGRAIGPDDAIVPSKRLSREIYCCRCHTPCNFHPPGLPKIRTTSPIQLFRIVTLLKRHPELRDCPQELQLLSKHPIPHDKSTPDVDTILSLSSCPTILLTVKGVPLWETAFEGAYSATLKKALATPLRRKEVWTLLMPSVCETVVPIQTARMMKWGDVEGKFLETLHGTRCDAILIVAHVLNLNNLLINRIKDALPPNILVILVGAPAAIDDYARMEQLEMVFDQFQDEGVIKLSPGLRVQSHKNRKLLEIGDSEDVIEYWKAVEELAKEMLPEWKLFELQDPAVKNSVVVPQANLDSRATSHRGRAMVQNGRGSSRGAGSLMTRGGHSDARGQSSHKRAKLF